MATRPVWKTAIQASVIVLLVLLIFRWGHNRDIEAYLHGIKQAGPAPFFLAMTLAPLAFVPATPFYLLAGAVFGDTLALFVTGLSILLNLAIAYAFTRFTARGLLRRATERFRRRAGSTMPHMNPWLFCAIVRATPGPTVAMKSYLLGTTRTPLLPYLVVSWLLSMLYAMGVILMGDSAMEGRWAGVLAGAGVLVALSAGLYAFRRWTQRRLAGARTLEDEGR